MNALTQWSMLVAHLYSRSTQPFEGAFMTIAEAATYLFVSRLHIRKLLASGAVVEVLPKDPNGQVNIDVASVEAYRLEQKAAIQAYQESKAEDDDTLGH